MQVLLDRESINKNDWNKFVQSHPEGNIFQATSFFDLNKQTKNYEPQVIVVQANNSISGILLYVIQKEHAGILGLFTARSIIVGGPLIINNSQDVLNILLKAYIQQNKRKVIFSQIRNLNNFNWGEEVFFRYGFKLEPHLNILVDLNGNTIENLHKSKKRNYTKSLNKGVSIITDVSTTEYEEAVKLIKSTYKRIKLPLVDSSIFLEAFKILYPKSMFKVFIAKFENEIIATRFVLLYNKKIYDWYAGDKPGFSNKYPNDFLIYEIFVWGIKNGYEQFDFGGAGKPDKEYGVREHKLRFGGKLIEPGRYEKIHKPVYYFIGKLGLQIYKLVK
jgi:serine/alanine adding enzyme